jgi:dTMP kinase
MNNERGKFIVFEGVGGSGKGTQIDKAHDLIHRNNRVIQTREPGGSPAAEHIRKLIFDLKDRKLIGPDEQMVLFFAARKIWMNEIVLPALDEGIHVLADRCYTSTGAYQGYAEGGDQRKILELADVVVGDYKPDAVILLKISRETSMKRRGKDIDGDPFDKETPEYFDRLIAGYSKMAKSGWGNLNWYVVNGEEDPETVSAYVKKVLEDILQKKLKS